MHGFEPPDFPSAPAVRLGQLAFCLELLADQVDLVLDEVSWPAQRVSKAGATEAEAAGDAASGASRFAIGRWTPACARSGRPMPWRGSRTACGCIGPGMCGAGRDARLATARARLSAARGGHPDHTPAGVEFKSGGA